MRKNQKALVILMNRTLKAGYKMVYWDQADRKGELVPEGDYLAHLKYQAFDEKLNCWVIFSIEEGVPHVPAPTVYECPFKNQQPNINCERLCTNSPSYGLGDTVAVKFALPVPTHVWLAIQELP